MLSGFLITSIIDQRIAKHCFSFSEFYLSRLRRLLPAALAMLVVTTILASYLLVPDDYIEYLRSAKNSALFNSNGFFDKLTSGYFSPDANKLHLLHTWSLSIEWQFYLVWPIAFFLLRNNTPTIVSTWIVLLLTLGLVWYSYHLTILQPEHSYFLFNARVFEMLIGASLALIIHKLPKLSPTFAHIVSLSGLFGLIAISVFYTDSFLFPGLNAFWVCLATVAIIYTGNLNVGALGNRLLSVRLMVCVGILSYSLYLWHWPLLAFLRVMNVEIDLLVISIFFFLTFVLSALTWYLVENPFRYRYRFKLWQAVVVFWLIPTLFFVGVSKLAKENAGFPARFGEDLVRIVGTIASVVTPNIDVCNPPKNLSTDKCRLGALDTGRLDAVLMGDSHARHFREFVSIIATDAGLSVYGVTAPACLPVPKLRRWNDKNYCRGGLVGHVYQVINQHKPRYVIMAQNWLGYAEGDNMIFHDDDSRSIQASQQRIEESVLAAMEVIAGIGSTPVIIQPTPGNEVNQKDCFYQHFRERRQMRSDECVINTQDEHKNNARSFIDSLFAKIREKHPNVIFIDPRKVQCVNSICFTVIDGVPMYEDEEHINSYASRWLAEKYLSKFGNPFKNK